MIFFSFSIRKKYNPLLLQCPLCPTKPPVHPLNLIYTVLIPWLLSSHCPEQAPYFTKYQISCPFPSLWSYQRISPGPRKMYPLRKKISFYSEELLAPCPTPKLEYHPCRLSATSSSIYSQQPSILEAVLPSVTWWCAMPGWQGPTKYGATVVGIITLSLQKREN